VTPRRDSSRRSPKASAVVAQQLVKHIVDASLPDGARLPNERELAEIFGVGRASLREGLRLLETRGVLTIRPGAGGGPVVRRPEPEDLSEALTLILQLKGSPLGDMLEARRAIEPTIARLAAAHITDAELDELQESHATMAELVRAREPEALLAENARFHAAIARIARNAALEAFLGSLTSIIGGAMLVDLAPRAQTAGFVMRAQSIVDAHQQIMDAMFARDPGRAEAAMQKHLDDTAQYWGSKYRALLNAAVEWAPVSTSTGI
jgi:DNA-binding FadR family transcriptional regulator